MDIRCTKCGKTTKHAEGSYKHPVCRECYKELGWLGYLKHYHEAHPEHY